LRHLLFIGIAYHPMGEKTFTSLEEELREAHDMRSRLTHGSLSACEPEGLGLM
jgi:hypothetical protein